VLIIFIVKTKLNNITDTYMFTCLATTDACQGDIWQR